MHLFFTVFWRGIRTQKHLLFAYAPIMLGLVGLWVLEPFYGRHVIDRVAADIEAHQPSPFLMLVAGWMAIYLVINLFQAANRLLRWRILRHLLIDTRETYYEHLLHLDIQHHVKSKTGELMKKIDNAADAIHALSNNIVLELTPSFVTSIVFFVVSFTVSWQLALIMVAMIPFYLLILYIDVRFTKKHWKKITALWVTSIGRGYDAIMNIFTVKSHGQENAELGRMKQIHAESIEELRKVDITWAIMDGIGYFMFMRILIMTTGLYFYARGDLSLGSLFFFQFSFFRTITPFEMLGNMIPQWNEKLEQLRQGEEIFTSPIHIRSPEHPKQLETLQGSFTFKNVTFSYGEIDAIHNLNLDVKPGEHIAFVGHSGAGKSTLAMLINRFYDVTDGSITVDGVDLREMDVHWWRSQIGLVLQENITFNDTILGNIRYARPDATLEEVMDAAKRASAHDFIEKLPQKYETMVGERGIRLSGGERQRVAIARAILKQPKIVVLDEATSALDSITERAVQNGIKELISGRTSFIIAHRLSTVRSVDRIAVLEGGKIIAVAPHDELLKTSPVYAKMVSLQQAGMLADEDAAKEDA